MFYHHRRTVAVVLGLLLLTGATRAGLHYSGEPVAELPSQWRGFLLDQRALRNLAVKPGPGVPDNPLRAQYQQAADRLQETSRQRPLTADELADLGAVRLRLGDVAGAVTVLRAAQREHPQHFRLAANLGTAWQLHGDLNQAAAALEQAVRLAPGKFQKAEEYHLKLVRLRQREAPGTQDLDDLFGVKYVGPDGKYVPGQLADEQKKKLPHDAVAMVQQLALWLPADGRLLWQLAEIANATGDVRTAAAILDGCATEFRLRHPDLPAHRHAVRAAADELAKAAAPGGDTARAAHEGHVGGVKPKSARPLLSKLDTSSLPPIKADGVNVLPWAVLGETVLDRKYKPTFAPYLKELDGKRVRLTGFLQPLGDALEAGSFLLIEYPVGCWYCEMPAVTGIILVELPSGASRAYTRGLVRVEGKLRLNATDPEDFLYTLGDATITEAD